MNKGEILMKIICTAEEKKNMLLTIDVSFACPFVEECLEFENCKACAEQLIEWEIVDE